MDITDTEAIALYVAAGNPREDWAALDDRDRYPWRKMALEMATSGGLEPPTSELEVPRSIQLS
jgi:glutathione S-transferase